MSWCRRILCLYLAMLAFFIVSCNSKSSDAQLPESMPKDFNFVFKYGVKAKNQLDTIKGQFTYDMVMDPSVTIDLKLTEEEMNTVYSEMKRINILNYPINFKPDSNKLSMPFYTYYIKIYFEGKEKSIYWVDKNISETEVATQLRDLFEKIQSIIRKKEEYGALPSPNGGYD